MTAKFSRSRRYPRRGKFEIRSGLPAGARVTTTGASALKDGDRIVAATPQEREGRGQRGERAKTEGSGQRQGSDR